MMEEDLETDSDGEIDLISRDKLVDLIGVADVYLQRGKNKGCLRLMKEEKGYRFVAYPGPAVVERGRAEHEPLHFHVKHKQLEELRILTENFSEMDGLFVPRRLSMIWGVKGIGNYLVRQTRSVYETGKLLDDSSLL